MINLKIWLDGFLQALDCRFGSRVWFVGLQGSYGRGEATEHSDIDLVVILDEIAPEDLAVYHEMLEPLPHRELICGFLSGKQELLAWEASDLFQFYHDTTPLVGSLDALIPLLDRDALNRAIKIGACGIYHGCVHNMLYDKSEEILQGLYKSSAFVLQAVAYRATGRYIARQSQLTQVLADTDRGILETALALKQGKAVDFLPMSEALFAWAQKLI